MYMNVAHFQKGYCVSIFDNIYRTYFSSKKENILAKII